MYGWRGRLGHIAPSRGDTFVYEFTVSREASYQLANKCFFSTPGADGIFIQCPRWPTIVHIDLLEKETGRPVVTSSQSYIWKALRMLKVKEAITGYGTLLRSCV